MPVDIKPLLRDLSKPVNSPLLTGILRGLEKESLRVDEDGRISQKPHPEACGSTLTHSLITTDYSEALLEFITPPNHCIDALVEQLTHIHKFTYDHLQNEYLWVSSMPCEISSDAEVIVGQYGSSNPGKMKTIYREGLGHRYGRMMQTISGIHYNFSLPSAFWAWLHNREGSTKNLQAFRTERYFDLIRNFRRYYWLLIYLFGASPAVSSSFVKNRNHELEQRDEKTLYAPFATSLRMGDLGYQSDAQSSLSVSYNCLEQYLATLCQAIQQPYADYEKIGVKDDAGNYQQLNTSLLQIENEFYSAIRPKRTAESGETALSALHSRGVEYIEVRCIDLNPFEPLGISSSQMHFIDTFLLFCLLAESPLSDEDENHRILDNQRSIVYRGRDPALTLQFGNETRTVKEWGECLFESLAPVAEMLDNAYESRDYATALEEQRKKLNNPALTPSAQVLQELHDKDYSYAEFGLVQARKLSDYFASQTLPADINHRFEQLSKQSIQQQHELEKEYSGDFESYLASYYSQYTFCNCDE